ncbi:MAG: hypothetical protein OEQ47_10205 [Acidimicrobiia bacterium]|nr:hypothetical protein [Acidimicrobiia bacterium]
MVLNEDPATQQLGLYGCSEISWFGTVEIGDATYGMALYPGLGRVTGEGTVVHYVEGWTVWTEEFTLTFDSGAGMYSVDDCTPGEAVLSGTDSGLWTARTGKFRSNGIVDEASAPFEGWLGRHVHQDGVIGLIDFGDLSGVVGFYGDLRLN